MPPLNVGNVLHKSAVVGLIGVTLAWGSYIPIRLYEVSVKAKELDEYAKKKNLPLEAAAAELGYAPVDERWLKKKEETK